MATVSFVGLAKGRANWINVEGKDPSSLCSLRWHAIARLHLYTIAAMHAPASAGCVPGMKAWSFSVNCEDSHFPLVC